MNLRQTRWKIAAFVMMAALLAGCGRATAVPSLEPTIDMLPTISRIQTQAVETAVMAMTLDAPSATPQTVVTETATLPPVEPTATTASTNTPIPTVALPTLPPTVVPTLIPTSTRFPATSTPASTATITGYSCVMTGSTPPFGYDLPPGGDFDGNWTVVNNGSVDWATNEIDVVFVSGTRFQENDIDSFDLPAAVARTKTFNVVIDMLAPREPGRYTATWALKRGGTTLCNLPVTIDVVQ